MNEQPHIQTMNNSILSTFHGSPFHPLGTEESLYAYQRKTPALGVDTVTTQLRKKFYGNSSNKSASYIAEKKRVDQIGLHTTIRPIQYGNTTQSISVEKNALNRVRNSGCVVPKKCTASSIAPTPTFNGRSISTNPYNPGGHSWFNITYSRWRKFCVNDITQRTHTVSSYYPDYIHGNAGTSNERLHTQSCPVAGGVLQSTGYAQTFTNIHRQAIYEPYQPSGF